MRYKSSHRIASAIAIVVLSLVSSSLVILSIKSQSREIYKTKVSKIFS